MESRKPSVGDRGISVGGNVTGSVLTTGDNNQTTYTSTKVPHAGEGTVDIAQELKALRAELKKLSLPDARKIDNALDDAEAEVAKAEPDKKEVASALERGLTYVKATGEVVGVLDKIKPYVLNSAVWLGAHGPAIARLLGFST